MPRHSSAFLKTTNMSFAQIHHGLNDRICLKMALLGAFSKSNGQWHFRDHETF
uniref:Uncharacterized protein n=1 Tax=Arundo donax TaxID=35708 RepID=A0A0A8Z0A6_ARUDO